MTVENSATDAAPTTPPKQPAAIWFAVDLVIYISVMFLIREIYFSQFNFITNGLFWSFTTLLTASILVRIRHLSWKELGLSMPKNYKQPLIATVFILLAVPALIITFNLLKDSIGLELAADQSNEAAPAKFGELAGNWMLFISIIPFIWIQSMLEEVLDRGFMINWIERALSSNLFATIMAVLIQALIFGFRHSYDISERSITVALIGLAMGIGYVAFGRNLWPLIIAHCIFNTMSMAGRV